MDKFETTSIIISEGLEYVKELNSLYVKALGSASEMFAAVTGATKGEAFVMFFGEDIIRLEELVQSLQAVREMSMDLR
jgi:hypothetical protein